MDRHFGGVIWTNHALARLNQRQISQSDAWATWKRPDNSRFAARKDAWIYYRTFGSQKIEVLAKKNEQRQWVVLSVWSRSVQKPKKAPPSLWQQLFNRIFGKT